MIQSASGCTPNTIFIVTLPDNARHPHMLFVEELRVLHQELTALFATLADIATVETKSN